MVSAASGEWAFDPDPLHASLAEITFTAEGEGTRVTVTHTGFERHGPTGGAIHRGVLTGWVEDLDDLHRAATAHRTHRTAAHAARTATGVPTQPRHDQRREAPMIENGFINLYTEDMQAALAFYVGGLGFRETFRVPQNNPDHVELISGSVAVALSTTAAARTHQGVEPTPGAPAGCLVLWVHDLPAAYDAAVAAGANTLSAPHAAGNGNCNALLRDPDGNLVELVAKTPGPAHPAGARDTDGREGRA